MKFGAIGSAFALSIFLTLTAYSDSSSDSDSQSDQEPNEDSPFFRQVWEQPFLVANEFFGTVLPGTLDKYNLNLTFRPRGGDFAQRDFIRWPIGVRYGFTETLEGQAGISPFTPNPFRGFRDHRLGLGEYRLGLRQSITPWRPFWNQAMVGFEFRSPLGRPPVDLIDGYAHIRPFMTMTRPSRLLPSTLFYLTLSHDHSFSAPFRNSDVPDEVIRQHISEITPGFLYKPGEWGTFIDYTTRWINEPTGTRHAHKYQVGVVWDPPRAQTIRLGLPRGSWQFELGYALTDEQERSLRHSVQFRARWEGDLKEFRRWSNSLFNGNNGNDRESSADR